VFLFFLDLDCLWKREVLLSPSFNNRLQDLILYAPPLSCGKDIISHISFYLLIAIDELSLIVPCFSEDLLIDVATLFFAPTVPCKLFWPSILGKPWWILV
jgi:hypothetical protein